MLRSPHNGSDCICPIFGAENKSTQCSEWLTCCVTSFGQVLYWTDFELWLCPSFPSGLLSALCAVSLLQLALCLSSYCTVVCEFISWKMRKQQTWSLSLLPLKHWFPLLLPQRGLISDKSRLSLVQAWILWGFIYWSFLPWMIFGIVLHYFVTLDTLPLVMLTSVPCFHGWLKSNRELRSVCALFFHWCCLFKDLSPMSMVVASGQKPHCGLMDYSSWKRWGMSQLLINQPIQIPGFHHSHMQKPLWGFMKLGQC